MKEFFIKSERCTSVKEGDESIRETMKISRNEYKYDGLKEVENRWLADGGSIALTRAHRD